MLKLYPSSDQEGLDFLELCAAISTLLDETERPADVYRVVHQNLSDRLNGIDTELYLGAPEDEILLPFSPSRWGTNVKSTTRVPDYLDRSDPQIAAFGAAGKPAIFNQHLVSGEITSKQLRETVNRCHLLIPLPGKNGLLGILYCGHQQLHFFKQQQLSGFAALGSIIASHVKRISGLHDSRKQIGSLQRAELVQKALYEISEAVHGAESMEQLYTTLHRTVGRLISARNFFIALTEESQDNTVISFPYYVDSFDSDFQGLQITLRPGEKHTITSFLIESRSPLLTASAEDFDEICRTNDITFFGAKPSSWLGVPFYNDHISGAVVVQSYDDFIYTEQDKDLLRYVATSVGAVLARKKRIDQLKEAKDKSEREKQKKSSFLATMSHEIRTPMNGIIGITNLLLGSDLDEQQRSYLDMIRKSSNRLLNLVNDILDFSKLEAGKMRIQRSTFRLRDSLAEPMSLLRVQTAQKKIGLKSVVDNNVPELLIGDPSKLCQIILNLMGNALKFTEAGEIRLRVRKDNQAEDKGAEQITLLFSVSDTGVGIPSDQQKKIFHAYEQLDMVGNDAYKGSGLGLVITTQLVESMNGRIWLESEPGEGSRFYVSLPFGIPAPVAQSFSGVSKSGDGDGAPGIRKIRILLAEDDNISQTIAVAMLEQNGWQVTAVNNGSEVLDELAEEEYDLVLMDIQMPNLDGFETTRNIRNHPEERIARIPIIAMTAHAMREDRKRCLAVGMNGYLSKPIETTVLMETIEKILCESRSL
jgi:signal transduction histidine kinase/ActR/RegA family two-component response regulator